MGGLSLVLRGGHSPLHLANNLNIFFVDCCNKVVVAFG